MPPRSRRPQTRSLRHITIVAVIAVPPEVGDESEDALLESFEQIIDNGWPVKTEDPELARALYGTDDDRRLIAQVRFATVHHGVTDTAVAEGADEESWGDMPRASNPSKKGKSKKDKDLLREAQALDASYAEAEAFDETRLDEWIKQNAVVVLKRTDYPKLGYIIHRFNEAGIPSIQRGSSFHGPLLRVHKDYEGQAWGILGEKMAPRDRKTIDDIADDDRRFWPYAETKPDMNLWEE